MLGQQGVGSKEGGNPVHLLDVVVAGPGEKGLLCLVAPGGLSLLFLLTLMRQDCLLIPHWELSVCCCDYNLGSLLPWLDLPRA